MARKHGLGRGLSALIPDSPAVAPDAPPNTPDGSAVTDAPASAGALNAPTTEVLVDRIEPNPQQPRTTFGEDQLQELADSISEHGIIQPLLVSQQGGGLYQLIAGERRWRAARLAGLERVPVTIRQTTPQQLLELAIIENVQRADLSPLEEGAAYQRLIQDFQLTQQQVAQRVGRSRTAIANTLRLLDLPAELRDSLAAGDISEGHARALLGIPDTEPMIEAWRNVVSSGLNVRQTEQLVRKLREPAPKVEAALNQAVTAIADPGSRGPVVVTEGIAAALQRALGTKVTLRRSADGSGTMTVHFYSDEELDGILERILEEDEL
jgi:ParB family transcriptional regulator, chromosome partitioning protein